MRRALGLASFLVRGALVPANQEGWTLHHKFLQVASYSSSSRPYGYGSAPSNLGGRYSGAVSFSVAKEPVRSDLLPKDVVLYQYEACPFCNKVKAFLDYYDIPYKVVEVNPITKKQIKCLGYKKVPILLVDRDQMVDSSDIIIDKLDHMIHPEKSVGSVSIDDYEEKNWRRWVDDHLVPILSLNIYRNPFQALKFFGYITNKGNFSFTERIIAKWTGAAAMYFVSKNLKKKYSTDERKALHAAANKWVDALNGRKFLGVSKPNLADLAVFGVLRPIRNLRSGEDMVKHSGIGEWYKGMESAVGEPSRIEASNGPFHLK